MKKLSYLFLALCTVATVGCKDEFFDINKNPNSPTSESITPNLILPKVLHTTASRMAVNMDYAAHWTGYWARGGTYGPSLPQEDYAITTNYQTGQWSGWYDVLTDVDIMQKKAEASNQGFYVGIAKVLKSIGFMYLVDQYNNVPYSKAFDLANNIVPAYDNGQDIYADLTIKLDEAIEAFKVANVAANAGIAAADITFKGDATKWIKLANTQKLKLAIRQSQITSYDGAAELAKVAANGYGFIGAGETAYVQPGYMVDNGKQNPFFDVYKLTYTGAIVDTYNRANNFVLAKFKNNNDERYMRIFSAAGTPLSGNVYYGYNFGEVLLASDPYKSVNSSDVAGPGLAKSATQSQWFFTSVESLFLQAEATQRGWITGDAEATYKSAIHESFAYLGVPEAATAATAYINSARPIVDWATATDKVSLIVMQKYLALTGTNNFEAYVDYRRVGVPSDLPMSLSPGRAGKVVPKRLMYPFTEYNYNTKNVEAQGVIDPQTQGVFWDK